MDERRAELPEPYWQDEGAVDLICCASRRVLELVSEFGWLAGQRSDLTLKYNLGQRLMFVDFNWREPDLALHESIVRDHRPRYAVAPDVEHADSLSEILRVAERLAEHAEHVIVVPKAYDVVEHLPAWVTLGYSVPSRYGGTTVWLGDFSGRPIHLLGGYPREQGDLGRYLSVRSLDGIGWVTSAKWGRWYDERLRPHVLSGGGKENYECALRRSAHMLAAYWRRKTSTPA